MPAEAFNQTSLMHTAREWREGGPGRVHALCSNGDEGDVSVALVVRARPPHQGTGHGGEGTYVRVRRGRRRPFRFTHSLLL